MRKLKEIRSAKVRLSARVGPARPCGSITELDADERDGPTRSGSDFLLQPPEVLVGYWVPGGATT